MAPLSCRHPAEGDIAQVLRDRGFEASPGLPSSDVTVKCDVVVVGSGSGGGVVAGQLAQAGYKVLVLEKGSYFSRDDLSLLELPSLQNMYEKGALWSTEDGGVAILAGTTVGGGSAVNWSASFRTQPHVIREWVDELGLKKFGAPEYAEALEAVCRKGGVQTERVVHNLPNEVLRRGCHKLGFHVGVVPRNAETEHECGWCGFGCAAGDKKVSAPASLDMREGGARCWMRNGSDLEAPVNFGRRSICLQW
jgi:long-chain-alcohol oxidase